MGRGVVGRRGRNGFLEGFDEIWFIINSLGFKLYRRGRKEEEEKFFYVESSYILVFEVWRIEEDLGIWF